MVNWWFIYRFPKNAAHPDGKQHVFDHEYLYYDATHSDPSKRPKPIHPEPDINPPQVQQPSKKKIKVAKKISTTKHKSLPKVKPKTKAKPKPKNTNHKAANDDDMDFSTLQDLEELDILSSNIITGKRKRPSTRRRLESLHQKLHQHKRNPLSNTLKQFFEDKKKSYKRQEWNAIVYSDDPPGPERSDSQHAHAKGVFAYHVTSSKGFWLIHSMPNFPNFETHSYEYDADVTYGQTFFCLTLHDQKSILNVVEQLRAMHKLKIYFKQKINHPLQHINVIPSDTTKPFDRLYEGDFTDMTTSCVIKDIVSQRQHGWRPWALTPKITHFAKSGNYHQDIFACIITELEEDFKFETWMRGGQRSFCTASKCNNNRCQYSHNLINVDRVEMNGYGVHWREDQDHAKIGCSMASEKYRLKGFKEYVCIGDMNRMYSQRTRGGGYLCIQDKHFWEVVHGILKEEKELQCEIPY